MNHPTLSKPRKQKENAEKIIPKKTNQMSTSATISCTCHITEIHVADIHATEIHVADTHATEIHVADIHATEIHVVDIHAIEIHAISA